MKDFLIAFVHKKVFFKLTLFVVNDIIIGRKIFIIGKYYFCGCDTGIVDF